MTRATALVSLVTATALAGCSGAADIAPEDGVEVFDAPLGADVETMTEVETEVVQETAAGFDHYGVRYDLSCGVIDPELVEPTAFATGTDDLDADQPLHRIRAATPGRPRGSTAGWWAAGCRTTPVS